MAIDKKDREPMPREEWDLRWKVLGTFSKTGLTTKSLDKITEHIDKLDNKMDALNKVNEILHPNMTEEELVEKLKEIR